MSIERCKKLSCCKINKRNFTKGTGCNCCKKICNEYYRLIWFSNPLLDPKTGKSVVMGSQHWNFLVSIYGEPPPINQQRRVIYLGYWLSNDDIPALVDKWKTANITHIILTFINQIDINKPLSDAYSMTLAYQELTPANQQLLKDNFILGVSYGGSAAMPSPYSNTFKSGAYYANNPQKLAQDLVELCGDLDAYYDLDLEYIDDQFDACVDFIGQICIELRRLKPQCQISHAPQSPYFTPQYGNVFNKIYANYHGYFNFFNIQYYNNGPSDTYEQIFINALDGFSAIQQLIQSGISASYLVMGKPVNSSEGSAGGYVPLVPTLGDIVQQAFLNPELSGWSSSAGSMIWYYNTQSNTSKDNDNILSYMNRISYFTPN